MSYYLIISHLLSKRISAPIVLVTIFFAFYCGKKVSRSMLRLYKIYYFSQKVSKVKNFWLPLQKISKKRKLWQQ